MNGISDKNLKKLGELIKLIGHKDLDIRIYKHRVPTNEVDSKSKNMPKSFHTCISKSGSDSWKEWSAYNMFGFRYIEVTMFYDKNPKKEGGEKIEDKSTI